MELIIVVGLFLVALSKGVDLYLYKEEKKRVRSKIEESLNKVTNTRIVDIPKKVNKLAYNSYLSLTNTPIKKIASILSLFILSLIYTSILWIIGNTFENGNGAEVTYLVWHDRLPWYPIYLVNLFYDFITLLITIYILRAIAKTRTIYSFFLIAADLTIAYLLMVICFLSFQPANVFFENIGIGTQFANTYKESRSHLHPYDTLSLAYEQFQEANIPVTSFYEVLKDGFPEDSTTILTNINNDYKIRNGQLLFLLDPRNYFPHLINGTKGFELHSYEIIASYKNRKETYTQRTFGYLNIDAFFVCSSTLFPSIFLMSLLFFGLCLKSTGLLFKSLSTRFLKSALETGSDNINRFSLGNHLSTALALLIAFIKILAETLKIFHT